jgi:hypothetical protein
MTAKPFLRCEQFWMTFAAIFPSTRPLPERFVASKILECAHRGGHTYDGLLEPDAALSSPNSEQSKP